ncbi:hypothetical protein Tco_0269377 [Tanacetum coccineum]
MCRRASAKLSSKWRFRKISMNFKAKRSSFSRIFSLFTLDGYGKVALVLGMTTGSSTWTIGVGRLGNSVRKVTCPFGHLGFNFTPEVEFEVHHMKHRFWW